ncbi:MAG: hypothetical protein IPG51_07980 [Chloroflexi bacterium]|nr:hypothetical protein [Chloroflexota bacterium]
MARGSVGALLAVGLALAAQSPKFLVRMRLAGYRLDLRAVLLRAITALILLAFGFSGRCAHWRHRHRRADGRRRTHADARK